MRATLKGGPELLAFLDAFPGRLVKGALRSGMTAGAKPIRDQARVNARKRSGKMAKAIKTGSPTVDRDGTVRVSVRLRGEHSFLGMFMEYGVAPHFISAGDGVTSSRLLTRSARRDGIASDVETRALRIGNQFVTGAVLHPGFPAYPFLRPALQMRAEDAVNAVGERIRSYLSSKTGFTAPRVEVADE